MGNGTRGPRVQVAKIERTRGSFAQARVLRGRQASRARRSSINQIFPLGKGDANTAYELRIALPAINLNLSGAHYLGPTIKALAIV
jgi:hypothetical protein